MTTRKLKSAARFGARYGKKVRDRVLKVEREQNKKRICPHCKTGHLKRKAAGLFECTKCKTKLAGGAYQPQTLAGSLVAKMIAQKGTSAKALAGELEKAHAQAKGYDETELAETHRDEPKEE